MRPGTGKSCASWDLTTVTDSRRPLGTRTHSLSSGGTPLVPSSGTTLITSSGAGGFPNPPTPPIPPPPSAVQPATPASSPAHVSTAAKAAATRRARPCPCLTGTPTTGPTQEKRRHAPAPTRNTGNPASGPPAHPRRVRPPPRPGKRECEARVGQNSGEN